MPKEGFYAVRKGRIPGIYSTWADCQTQIKGFSDAKYKRFANLEDAQSFLSGEPSDTSDLAPALKQDSKDSKSKKRAFGPEVSDTTGWDIVYSDGACKGNGKADPVAGVGVWWGAGDPRNIAERCPGDQTNNRAELIAILRVLETAPLTKPLLIRTDSQYSIQCFKTWIIQWQKKNWRTSAGEHVKNAGIIRCISKRLQIRAKSGQKVVLEYVQGHSGNVGNDGADAMANRGALLPEVAERDWAALEKNLDAELSKTTNSGEVSHVTVLAPDSLAGSDDVEAPTKVQRVLDHSESFSRSKLATQHSCVEKPSNKPSAKESLSSGSAHSSSIPSSSRHGHTYSTPPKPNYLKSRQKPISIYPHISGDRSPLTVICAHPPLVPVQVADVNVDDYSGCLLDDDDLANEISD